jgi:hypothetical protein
MKNKNKKRKLEHGLEDLDILAALDFRVKQFSPYHFRINERLDVWPSSKSCYDILAHRKQGYTDLARFVQYYFEHLPITEVAVT